MHHIHHHHRARQTTASQLTVEIGHDNAGRKLTVSLILTGENLAGHPQQRRIDSAISWWRAGAARNSDKACFACHAAFGIGRAAPGAFLVAIGTRISDAAIGGLCTTCLHAKTDAEIDQAAATMLRRITGPRGRWLDPHPSQRAQPP
jgi:hypothetical protein